VVHRVRQSVGGINNVGSMKRIKVLARRLHSAYAHSWAMDDCLLSMLLDTPPWEGVSRGLGDGWDPG
jgi:hypothetical protein